MTENNDDLYNCGIDPNNVYGIESDSFMQINQYFESGNWCVFIFTH